MFPFDIEDEEAMPEIEEASGKKKNWKSTKLILKAENLLGERSAEKKL